MTVSCTYAVAGRGIRCHSWTWVCSANGVLTGVGESDPISGTILQFQAHPTSGSEPTAAYDVELQDDKGVDWLFGAGADLSNNPSSGGGTIKTPLVANYQAPILSGVQLTPSITNAGDSKGGILRIWTQDPMWSTHK